jgi:hypothetical protein
MKCQSCDNQATLHVTELVNGQPTEIHVCEAHFDDLDKLKAAMERQSPNSLMAFLGHPGIREAMGDPEARKKVVAHLLPALCLALLDSKPEVKVIAIYHLMMLGPDAQSAVGALQDARQDANENVRQAAECALKCIESDQKLPWMDL